MKAVNTILGAVAMMLASSVAVKADDLIAGPLPFAVKDYCTITCSATNISPSPEAVTITIQDAADLQLPYSTSVFACNLDPTHSCQAAVSPALYGGTSPAVCNIHSQHTVAPLQPAAVRGSICGQCSGIFYCLQAELDNNLSD